MKQSAPKPKKLKKPAAATAPRQKLPAAWALTRKSTAILWRNKGLFGGIILIYALLTLILVRGFNNSVVMDDLQTLLGSDAGKVVGSLAAYSWLINTSTAGPNQIAGVYQTIVLVIISLSVVWALRQVLASEKSVRVRDAFYQGMYPLIPVTLVLIILFLLFIPLLLGLTMLNMVAGSTAIAVQPVEIIIGIIVCVTLIALSLYLFVSYIFAFYIATLPDMTPVRALRSSRQLVSGRRLSVLRKLLWLPFLLLIVGLVIMVPIILLATPLAPWVAFALTILILPVVHSYLYTMYRELIA